MLRSIISMFLSLLFVALIAMPTIITCVDDSIDISCFYASGEEEEKGSEKNKEIELLFFEVNTFDSDFAAIEVEDNLEYFFKAYTKPHLNLISPPPQS
ncbi:MAG: hypothetical protein ABJL44_01445 [Algibacter sp.]